MGMGMGMGMGMDSFNSSTSIHIFLVALRDQTLDAELSSRRGGVKVRMSRLVTYLRSHTTRGAWLALSGRDASVAR